MSARLLLSTTLLLSLAACTPAAVSPPASRPSPSPTASPTPTLTPQPGGSASPVASASPEAPPLPSPLSTPIPTPTATPTPASTPSPSATPIPEAILSVRVFDDKGEIRSNATVQLSATNPDFNQSLSAEAGIFRQSLPPNRIFKVTASEGGMTTRSQNISLSPGENKLLEFRDDHAISDKPEIIAIEPGYSKAWDPYATIRITFSESMDKDAVENAVAIQSTDSDATFLAGNLPVPYSESFMSSPNTVVYDIGQFIPRWENGDRVLALEPRVSLPATTRSNFRLVFNHQSSSGQGGILRDRAGIAARDSQPRQTILDENDRSVTIQDGPVYINGEHEPYIPFSISGSFRATLGVNSVSGNASSASGDYLRVTFNEPVFLNLPSGLNLPPDETAGALNPDSYRLNCNGSDVPMPPSALVTYLGDDAVELKVIPSESLFAVGDSCKVSISGIITPTGERIQTVTRSFKPL